MKTAKAKIGGIAAIAAGVIGQVLAGAPAFVQVLAQFGTAFAALAAVWRVPNKSA